MIELDTQIIPTARAMSFLYSGRVQLSKCAKNFTLPSVLSTSLKCNRLALYLSKLCPLKAARDDLRCGGSFNMSRTLSRGKTGPDPDYFGVRPFPHINHPCGDHGVSFRRSSLQFNIRPWRVSALGNPLLRLGLPRRSTVFWRGWRIAALAKKKSGVSPNGLGSNRRDG